MLLNLGAHAARVLWFSNASSISPTSPISQSRSVTPASIALVTLRVWWILTKLLYIAWSATAQACLSTCFETKSPVGYGAAPPTRTWTELCPHDYSICAGGRSPHSVCSASVPPVEGNRRDLG